MAVNTPYSGAITPLDYYRKNRNVISVMIEINRGLYLNHDFRKNAAFFPSNGILKQALMNQKSGWGIDFNDCPCFRINHGLYPGKSACICKRFLNDVCPPFGSPKRAASFRSVIAKRHQARNAAILFFRV